MKAQLDDLDIAILGPLYEDGRMPATQIARRLGYVSTKTVSNRIKRLTERGFVQIRAVAQPKALGYGVTADISVEVAMGKVREVGQAIASLPSVTYVAIVAGDRDLQIQVVALDVEDLQRFVLEELQAVPNILRMKTSVLTEVITATRDWMVPAKVD